MAATSIRSSSEDTKILGISNCLPSDRDEPQNFDADKGQLR